MQKEPGRSVWWWVVAVSFGLVMGYLMASDPSVVRKLRADLDALKRQNEDLQIKAQNRRNTPVVSSGGILVETAGLEKSNQGFKFVAPDINVDPNAVRDIELRRRQGEYILEDEFPASGKAFAQSMSNLFSRALSNNAAHYSKLFSDLKLDPAVSGQLEAHLAKINVATAEAEQAINQLLLARHDYDNRMRQLLSPEDYASYRQNEDSRPSASEYSAFQDFAQKNTLANDLNYQQVIMKLIQDSQAYTRPSSQGPYGGIPEPALGDQAVTALLQKYAAALTDSSAQLLQNASIAGLPEEYQNSLKAYYDSKLQYYQTMIAGVQARMQMTPQEKANETKQNLDQMQQWLRQQVASPPPQ